MARPVVTCCCWPAAALSPCTFLLPWASLLPHCHGGRWHRSPCRAGVLGAGTRGKLVWLGSGGWGQSAQCPSVCPVDMPIHLSISVLLPNLRNTCLWFEELSCPYGHLNISNLSTLPKGWKARKWRGDWGVSLSLFLILFQTPGSATPKQIRGERDPQTLEATDWCQWMLHFHLWFALRTGLVRARLRGDQEQERLSCPQGIFVPGPQTPQSSGLQPSMLLNQSSSDQPPVSLVR